MTVPTVTATATTNGTTASATPVINLPATVNVDDIILVFIRQDNEETYTWPANWNVLPPLPDISDGSDDQTSCRYKIADGTEDGTTIQLTRTQSNKFAALSYAIGGATSIEAGGLAIGASVTVQPATFLPSGGTQDYLALWMGAMEGEQTSPPTGNPTNFTNPIGANSGTAGAVTTNCRVASARRSLPASSGPSATPWTISASDDWTAFFVALWTQPPNPPQQGFAQGLGASY